MVPAPREGDVYVSLAASSPSHNPSSVVLFLARAIRARCKYAEKMIVRKCERPECRPRLH